MSGPKFTESIPAGTVVQWIVGMPGPDCDMALVVKCYGPGSHRVRFKVWGEGSYFEKDVRGYLWPDPMFPGQWDERIASELRQEWARIEMEGGE